MIRDNEPNRALELHSTEDRPLVTVPLVKYFLENVDDMIHRLIGNRVGERVNRTQKKIPNYNPDDYMDHGEAVYPTTVHVPQDERIEEPVFSSQQIEA